MGRPKRRLGSDSGFEIWQTGSRIHSVDHPIRFKILQLLEQKPRTLKAIAFHTRRAKSTLSTLHLGPLVQAGLVLETLDPSDARIKWYKLTGHRLGSSHVDRLRLRDAVLDYVQSRGMIPLRPILEVLDLETLVSLKGGQTYATSVANRLGHLLAKVSVIQDSADRLKELKQWLEREGLGTIEGAPPKLKVKANKPTLEGFLSRVVESALREKPSET